MATQAVRHFGMFADNTSFISKEKDKTSDTHNSEVDKEVQKILDESYHRVKRLLINKDKELRDLAKGLFVHDYLDADEMDRIISGKGLDLGKERIREVTKETYI